MKKKFIKTCAWSIALVAVTCLALMLICDQIVVSNAEGKVFSDIDSIRYNKVGLLLGLLHRRDLIGLQTTSSSIVSMRLSSCIRLERLSRY